MGFKLVALVGVHDKHMFKGQQYENQSITNPIGELWRCFMKMSK